MEELSMLIFTVSVVCLILPEISSYCPEIPYLKAFVHTYICVVVHPTYFCSCLPLPSLTITTWLLVVNSTRENLRFLVCNLTCLEWFLCQSKRCCCRWVFVVATFQNNHGTTTGIHHVKNMVGAFLKSTTKLLFFSSSFRKNSYNESRM